MHGIVRVMKVSSTGNTEETMQKKRKGVGGVLVLVP